jgi:hypothetical protein
MLAFSTALLTLLGQTRALAGRVSEPLLRCGPWGDWRWIGLLTRAGTTGEISALRSRLPWLVPPITIAHHGYAALRDFNPAYVADGVKSVTGVMSAARPLFHRKRKSITILLCRKSANRWGNRPAACG